MELTYRQQQERRAKMLQLREQKLTMAVIGARFGLSRQRVAQILEAEPQPPGNPSQRPRSLELLQERIDKLGRLPAHDLRRLRIPRLEAELHRRQKEQAA